MAELLANRRKSLRRPALPPQPPPATASDVPSVSASRLTKSDFQPEDYLKETLRSADEPNIRQFRQALEDSRKVASKNLQKNVYKNYESFVFISKEISSMERDMQLLRELLHSISQVGDDLMEEEEDEAPKNTVGVGPRGGTIARRRTMRMSMANQQDMFKDQLAKLWRNIRDAQRFVPFAPNRHVVGDVRNVSELSPSTFQTRQRVDIVVLSDMILLAVRKRRGNTGQSQAVVLVADRSFQMKDAVVTDVSEKNSMVKIVNRAETFLFGFKNQEAKNELLMLIGHARAGIFGAAEPMPALPRTVAEEPDTGHNQRDDEMMEGLEIHIARREFKQAARAVQRLKQRKDELTVPLRRSLETHTQELARLILADLLIPCAPRKQVSFNVTLLHDLGWDKESKEAFLVSRSATIKNRTRQLKLEGNTRLYIRELAVVYFRLIRNTCEWYSELFEDPTMVSGLIAWVRQEMSGYAAIFRRHVFHDMQRFQVVAGCLNHTLAEVNVLGHAGLDLKFMLDQEFFPDLTDCIKDSEKRYLGLLVKSVSTDSLQVVSKIEAGSEQAKEMFGEYIPIIESVNKLDEVLMEFGNELRHIVRDSLYGQVVASVLAIIEGVLKQLLQVLRKGQFRGYQQEFALLVSTKAVVHWVIPRSASHLDRIFERTVTDIHNLEQRLEAFPGSLQDVFCQKHAIQIARQTFDFVTTSFVQEKKVDEQMEPSKEMEALLVKLGEVARELDQWPGSLDKRKVLAGIVDCLFIQMIDHRNWETSDGTKRQFSHFGVHCLVLDIHFLLRVCGSLVTKSTNSMANRVCEKSLRLYFASHQKNAGEMMNKSWYDARVHEAMQRLGFVFPDFGKGFEHRSEQSFEQKQKSLNK